MKKLININEEFLSYEEYEEILDESYPPLPPNRSHSSANLDDFEGNEDMLIRYLFDHHYEGFMSYLNDGNEFACLLYFTEIISVF